VQIGGKTQPLERCDATIEISKDGTVVTFYDGQVSLAFSTSSGDKVPHQSLMTAPVLQETATEFLFKERAWPRTCIIEVCAC
jgi:hypothetical protein